MFRREVKKRYFENNLGEIIIQREHRIWWTFWLAYTYEDHELLDNKVYSIEEKLNKKVDEIKRLLTDLQEAKDQLERDRKEIRKDTYAMRGYSDVFIEKCNWFFGTPVFKRKPESTWKGALNNKLINKANPKKGIQQSVREKTNIQGTYSVGDSDHKVAIVPDQYKVNFNSDGYDEVHGYKKPSNPNNKSKGGNNQNNRQKGDSNGGSHGPSSDYNSGG
jgi:hypothetical protein